MINQTLSPNTTLPKNTSFGVRLRTAREALGMDRKEAAAQLRLHESMIIMIEKGEYQTNLPLTFIRGYIRNYSKLLEIPEKELKEALDLLQPRIEPENETIVTASTPVASPPSSLAAQYLPVNIGNFFMKLFTYLLAITLIGLVGVWWHTHKTTHPTDLLTSESIPSEPTVLTPSTHVSDASRSNTGSKNMVDEDAANAEGAKAGAATQSIEPVTTSTTQPIATPEKPKNIKLPFTKSDLAHHFTNLLTDLILFLIILTLGMRFYDTRTNNRSNAKKVSNTEMPSNFPAFTIGLGKLTNHLPEFRTIILVTGPLIAAFVLGFGGTWLYNNIKFKTPVIAEKQIDKKAAPIQIQPSINILPIDDDLEKLAPSPNFNSALLSHLKINDLQAMANQLDAYIAQAATTKFALTDKSTPIGQFIYKKKSRRYRQPRRVNNVNNINNPAPNYYNNNNGRTVPPYYYFH